MDNKNYLKSFHAAMDLALIKSFSALCCGYQKKNVGYLITKGKMLKIYSERHPRQVHKGMPKKAFPPSRKVRKGY